MVFLAEHVVELRSGEVFDLVHPNCLVFSSVWAVSVEKCWAVVLIFSNPFNIELSNNWRLVFSLGMVVAGLKVVVSDIITY